MSKVSRVLATLLALVFAGAVGATPLSALLNGGSLTVGDKLFDNWALQGQGLIDTTGQVDLGNIDVTGSVSGNNVVLRFNAGDELAVTGDNMIDLFFGYRVSVLPGSGMKIDGVAFRILEGGFLQDGLLAGTEDIVDGANNALGSIDLEFSNVLTQLSGSAAFDPVSEIFVLKNILLNGFADPDAARLVQFSQTFSQVPAPATLWLLAAAGLVGLVTRRRASTPRR